MASWHQHTRSQLQSVKCPAHGNLAVRRADTSWVMRCQTCLDEAATAIHELWRRAQ